MTENLIRKPTLKDAPGIQELIHHWGRRRNQHHEVNIRRADPARGQHPVVNYGVGRRKGRSASRGRSRGVGQFFLVGRLEVQPFDVDRSGWKSHDYLFGLKCSRRPQALDGVNDRAAVGRGLLFPRAGYGNRPRGTDDDFGAALDYLDSRDGVAADIEPDSVGYGSCPMLAHNPPAVVRRSIESIGRSVRQD